MALVIRRAALRGLAGAVPTALGVELGLYAWALFAGTGLAALVAASKIGYLVLRVVGAAVLLGLGVRAWRAARHVGRAPEMPGEWTPTLGLRCRWTVFAEGLVVQLANPKAAVLMIASYPQFVPAEGSVLGRTALLGLLQVTVETGLYLALAAGVARAGTWFRRPRIRRRLEAVSGTVLVALGLRVAASGR
ncbi:LysE family translocator [Geodermatophilus sp. TF02-6]|uniref:LysE family translocator n=1 Tax=Geodermatophilus sp. TF02-6 TaxID=2250575 RepID=UPI0018F604FF|nr:LysE family translocator [Geodermatophilus sp. TF02-6]